MKFNYFDTEEVVLYKILVLLNKLTEGYEEKVFVTDTKESFLNKSKYSLTSQVGIDEIISKLKEKKYIENKEIEFKLEYISPIEDNCTTSSCHRLEYCFKNKNEFILTEEGKKYLVTKKFDTPNCIEKI